MKTSRKVVAGLLVSAVTLAVAIPGLVKVFAIDSEGEIFEDGVTRVIIIEPETISFSRGELQLPIALDVINVYTEEGEAPSEELLIETAVVFLSDVPPGTDVSRSLQIAIDGELDTEAGSWTGPAPLLNVPECEDCLDTLRGEAGLSRGIFFTSLSDLSNAESLDTCENCIGGHSVVLRALAKVDTSYTGYMSPSRAASSGITGADAIEVVIEVFVNEDEDENGIPDVGQIFGGNGQTEPTGVDGTDVKTTWANLGSVQDRGVSLISLSDTLRVQGGGLNIEVETANMSMLFNSIMNDDMFDPTLRTAVLDAYNAGDIISGALVLSRSNSTNSLTDDSETADSNNPISLFDLETDEPSGTFMAITIILELDDGTNPPTYLPMGRLPGSSHIFLTLTGDAIAANLQNVLANDDPADVFAYRFPTDITFDGMNMLNSPPDMGAWVNVEGEGTTLSFLDIDDLLDRATIPAMSTPVGLSMTLGTSTGIIGTTVTPKTGGAVGGGGSSGICFIATAAYGTPLADEIGVLRGLRDSYMLNNMVGTAFVDTYYRLSPPVADVVAHNAFAKALVRTLLVPVLMLSGFALAMPGASAAMLLVALAFAGYRVRKSVTRS